MYTASVDGQRLTFDVFGVWRKNMIMRDRETGSLWQHATGEAIDGPLAKKQLDVLLGWETTWRELQTNYPQATFIIEPEIYTGVFPKKVLHRLLNTPNYLKLSGIESFDLRLDSHAIVIGIVFKGVSKAYPLDTLKEMSTVHDTIGGEAIILTYNSSSNQVSILTSSGKSIPYEKQWWLGWIEFHPRSEIFNYEKTK